MAGVVLLGDHPESSTSADQVRYQCAGLDRFRPADLTSPHLPISSETSAQLDHVIRTATRALGYGAWYLVQETPEFRLYLAAQTPGSEAPFVFVLEAPGGTVWKAQSWGECTPRAIVGTSDVSGEVRLAVSPVPSDTTLAFLVSRGGCISLPSVLVLESTANVVAIAHEPSSPDHPCAAVLGPPERLIVPLANPVGLRDIYDGGVFPYRLLRGP